MTPGVAAVLGGSPDAKTTEFGDACEYFKFQSFIGSEWFRFVDPEQLLMCCSRRVGRT